MALAPLVGLLVAATSHGNATLLPEAEPAPFQASIAMLLFAPIAALSVRAQDVALLDVGPALVTALVGGVVGLLLVLRIGRIEHALVFAIAAGFYAGSLGVEANALARPPTTTFASVEVADKRETDEAYLLLIPPRFGVPDEIAVTQPFYAAVRPGDEVCILIHHGVFGWRFWELDFCPR